MPIYKVGNDKKDGLQKYYVRINYIADNGTYKQITRTVYGIEVAKDLERQLEHEIKVRQEMPVMRMTVKQLYDEYVSVKKYEVRETTVERTKLIFRLHIFPAIENVRIDKLSAKVLQDWKVSIEEKHLALKTRKNIYSELRTMLNYAVRMEYISKNPLLKIGNFKDALAIKQEISFYTADEFRKYIDIAKKTALQKQREEKSLYEWNYYVFFNIAFYTGLRKRRDTRLALE